MKPLDGQSYTLGLSMYRVALPATLAFGVRLKTPEREVTKQ